jgi:hypothetical protein
MLTPSAPQRVGENRVEDDTPPPPKGGTEEKMMFCYHANEYS